MVRSDQKGIARGSKKATSLAVRGGGLLQQPEQLAPEDAEALARLVLKFASELVRNTCGGDIIILSKLAAFEAEKPNDRVAKAFISALFGEMSQRRWPAGF